MKLGIAVVITMGLALGSMAQPAQPLKIGTFDSRVVALAYRNSSQGMAETRQLMQEFKRAQDAKDQEQIGKLQALGPSRQHLAHQQVFSNASIVDIVPKFRDAIPAIAKKHGVALVVSKWEVVYAAPGIETVDVTRDIVDFFGTTPKVEQWIDAMKKQEPLPLQDLVYEPEH